MNARRPTVSGKDVVRALKRVGFVVSRIVGSHHVMRHTDGRTTTVPVHSQDALPTGTLANILKNAGLTADQLRALL
ncbi:type II toxin-antitoxin system HicA family toxin [bacterium]|nr:MAG: type II toxin-antitoxin system HicA family toxin [bacterium]